MDEYFIEHKSDILIVRLRSKLSFEMLVKVLQDVAKQHTDPRRMWDVTAGFDYTSDQIQQFASLGKQLWPDSARVAFLAESELAFGLIRMLEAYREEEGYISRVFNDEQEALDWLTDSEST